MSCSSKVPDAADARGSHAGAAERAEQSEAATHETAGSHQPARARSPAQVMPDTLSVIGVAHGAL